MRDDGPIMPPWMALLFLIGFVVVCFAVGALIAWAAADLLT